MKRIKFGTAFGTTVRQYLPGPALPDYTHFVDRQRIGILKALSGLPLPPMPLK
ncbi:MAG: hypothetical protein ABI589_13105 [Burkholderiales bacterium]